MGGSIIHDSQEGWHHTVHQQLQGTQQKDQAKAFAYPLNIQDMLLNLEGFQYATSLDLNMGYYHIELCPDNRVRINKSLRHHINAFASLATSLRNCPTHLAEVVPQAPSLLGTTDAAKVGMGGVYFDASGQGYVWRFPFPEDIQSQLISKANPSGRITNSNLEQAGLLAQVSVISHHHDVTYPTIANGLDNMPAVSHTTKGAVTSDGPAAHLCNYACAHQRQHHYCHVPHFLPGDANVMADDALRLQHLTDSAFLAYFQQEYLQPEPW
jgi:hypothetical protein